jgi:hypothetical protein
MEAQKAISLATKRWIARELENGRMTMEKAMEIVAPHSKNPYALVHYWRKKYAPEIALTLPIMTEKEKQKLEAVQERVKELERQLEAAQMKNIALETMIDVAEEQLRIAIRKKSGPRQ